MTGSPSVAQRRAAVARRARWTTGAAFAAYLLLAIGFFGVRVLEHPGRTYVGGLAADPQIFIWSFAWWPHAILHGENPFYTHAIWAPDGFNLAWATSVPGLAVAFAPLTLSFGPVVSYNVASILMPALAAWTAFLLCRRLTRATWPSLAGGYLFGFSSYMLGGEIDHIHTTSVFLVPLAALLVLRYLDRELTRARFAVLFGVLLAVQMSFSTEVLFTLTIALAAALVLAFALVPAVRAGLVSLVLPLAAAYALAAALMSPLLYYVLSSTGSKPPPGLEDWVADAVNFVVPTRLVLLGNDWSHRIATHFPTNDVERGAYLGLPVLVIVALFAARRLRDPAGRFLLAAFVLSAVASLGSWLTVNGHRVVTFPWSHVAYLPLLENTMFVRLSLFTALAAAVIVALWTASRGPPASIRCACAVFAVLAVLPDPTLDVWARSTRTPPLFTSGRYKACLREHENAIVFPFGPRGDSLIWQAESDFWFRLAGGYISPKVPDSFLHPAAVAHVTTADNPAEVTLAGVLELARQKSVTAILVDARRSEPWRTLFRKVSRPEAVGGVLIYRVGGSLPRPGCTGRRLQSASTSAHATSR